jgi:hypothetical protein
MNRHTLPALLAILVMATSCQKENKDEKQSEPTALPEKVATSSIASVQIEDDCPDPKPVKDAADEPPTSYKPASPAVQQPPAVVPVPSAKVEMAPAPARPSRRAPVASDQLGTRQGLTAAERSCTQSTIQIVFSEQGPRPSSVAIKSIRLLTPEGKKLATMKSRLPSQWNENVYSPWDEILKPNENTTVSYKLSPPDWNAVTTELGKSSHGQMFILEVEIDVGGQVQTVRSSEFARIQHHALPT